MCRETNYIIHCAASIRFDEPISEIMQTNYVSTRQLLEVAASMPFLRCFTYMSTAYVNSNLPRHSKIEEKIYPLPGTSDPLAVAQELLDLQPAHAERKVSYPHCLRPSLSSAVLNVHSSSPSFGLAFMAILHFCLYRSLTPPCLVCFLHEKVYDGRDGHCCGTHLT